MNLEKLRENRKQLLRHMEEAGYSKRCIVEMDREIDWILSNAETLKFKDYEQAFHMRTMDISYETQKSFVNRLIYVYGNIMRYALYDMYPQGETSIPLIRLGAYNVLCPEYRAVADSCLDSGKKRGLKDRTIKGIVSRGSNFLAAMQNKGCHTLAAITEEHVIDFFTDAQGHAMWSNSYRRQTYEFFHEILDAYSPDARRIILYLPIVREKRKNVCFLTEEEIQAVRLALEGNSLSFRNRAIGYILLYTGLRAGDIASLKLTDINWEKDEIHITQQKTGEKITLPLTAVIGNAIYDYISEERAPSSSPYLFLSENRPFGNISPGALYTISENIYKAAGIRQEKGARRGTHLFRYHLASKFAENGVSHPVINYALGHSDPGSLDPYLFADICHLRECALSIEAYPVGKDVLNI